MENELKKAFECFENKDFKGAMEIFVKSGYTFEAGVCCLVVDDLKNAVRFFKIKSDYCMASNFGIIITDIIQDKTPNFPKYFQTRAYLEVFLNFLIENKLFSYAQKIIDNYNLFTRANPETPKFIARVLSANDFNRAVHRFCAIAKDLCRQDAEAYYIDAELYIKEKNTAMAKENIETCLKFAPEYYPMKVLEKKLSLIS